jgi:hypothetical protein
MFSISGYVLAFLLHNYVVVKQGDLVKLKPVCRNCNKQLVLLSLYLRVS